MEKRKNCLVQVISYVLVAALAAVITAGVILWTILQNQSKLSELESVISKYFVEDVDVAAIEDAAAASMVDALGDRWSYYIPADQYGAFVNNQANAYVGVGITISAREDGTGMDILAVEPSGGASDAGILPGDVLIQVDDQQVAELTMDEAKVLVQGDAGTMVSMTVMRDEEKLTFQVERRNILLAVATGQMLEKSIGLVTISNFNERCAEETIAVIDNLVNQGAEALIFDVRFNPGGYKDELVKILDYLLPEGDLFSSEDYAGTKEVDTSDANCLKLPMAVLINGDSYSAAEFFAAALSEYDWAILVGQPTTGKSRFQYTIELSDGSAVNLSVGKYYTPKGVSLADEGGLTPDVLVEVDEEMYAKIYNNQLTAREDPQIQAAIAALQ